MQSIQENRLLAEDSKNALPDLTRLLTGINAAPDTGLLVVVDDRGGLGVVSSQTLGEGFGIVIGTLDQRLSGDVVLHVNLGRVEDLVVRAARGRVDQAAGDTSHQQRVVNLQLNGVLELLITSDEHVIETLGLRNRPGETIQNETDHLSC